MNDKPLNNNDIFNIMQQAAARMFRKVFIWKDVTIVPKSSADAKKSKRKPRKFA